MSDAIRITLDGVETVLVPSFEAAKALSEKYTGLLQLMEIVNFGSLDASADIIGAALGKDIAEKKRDKVLSEKVYDAGLKYLAPHLVRYVIALTNGGKVPVDA